jgi:hypothetical protein
MTTADFARVVLALGFTCGALGYALGLLLAHLLRRTHD